MALVAAARAVPLKSAPAATAAPIWAAALLAACPLFWLSGLRPMSDLPGLAAALVAQALILQGRRDRARLIAGALVAGLAAGIRVQTVWLTVPLWPRAGSSARARASCWLLTRPVAALAVAGLAWAVPLVVDSGGLAGYLRALGTQAGEDFAWVNMLWLEPTPRRLAFALYETFVLPWGSVPLAVARCRRARRPERSSSLVRDRAGLAVLLVAFGPYAAFHLLFQETITVRYALPTLPLVAWLAARGFSVGGTVRAAGRGCRARGRVTDRGGAGGAGVRRAAASRSSGRLPPPGSGRGRRRPRRVRALQPLARAAGRPGARLPLVEPRRQYEWLGPVEYWKGGGTGPSGFWPTRDAPTWR